MRGRLGELLEAAAHIFTSLGVQPSRLFVEQVAQILVGGIEPVGAVARRRVAKDDVDDIPEREVGVEVEACQFPLIRPCPQGRATGRAVDTANRA